MGVVSKRRDNADIVKHVYTGVINILTYLNKYAIVKDSEIENLRILINDNYYYLKNYNYSIPP
mgnify:CR=1 FL=1